MGVLVDARMIFAEIHGQRYEALWQKLWSGDLILDSRFDDMMAREPAFAAFLRLKIAEQRKRQQAMEDDGA
jgi:hypothetical protein